MPDLLEDEMYIMQKKYPNLIYSHETALFCTNCPTGHPLNILQQCQVDIRL